MMDDIGIGNRQNDLALACAEFGIECILQIEHIRLAIGGVLVVHAMIGGDDEGDA